MTACFQHDDIVCPSSVPGDASAVPGDNLLDAVRSYPHFMAEQYTKHQSEKALGMLYDLVVVAQNGPVPSLFYKRALQLLF